MVFKNVADFSTFFIYGELNDVPIAKTLYLTWHEFAITIFRINDKYDGGLPIAMTSLRYSVVNPPPLPPPKKNKKIKKNFCSNRNAI